MAYSVLGSMKPDSLIGDHEFPVATTGVTLEAGQGILKRGSVIGIITANQKGKLCDANSTDGSQVGKYILSDDVDTTSDAMSVVFQTGCFNKDALIFGTNGEPSTVNDDLRDVGIYVKNEYPIV